MKVEPFEPLDPALYREIVRRALAEDIRWGDITTEATVAPTQRGVGVITARAACVLAGMDVALETFQQLDPQVVVSQRRQDAEPCEANSRVLTIMGFASALLTAERTALNFLQRLSGTATLTRRFVDVAKGRTVVLDTRKTTPTLRVLQKYAVRAGGGVNHRMALDDGLLIKDNHLRLVGSIRQAVVRAREAGHAVPIEVEAQSLADVDDAVDAGADIILLDNMSIDEVRESVHRVRGRAKVEVSGGVSLDQLDAIAEIGPDYVSAGVLTHSAPAVDFSLAVYPEGRAPVDPSAA